MRKNNSPPHQESKNNVKIITKLSQETRTTQCHQLAKDYSCRKLNYLINNNIKASFFRTFYKLTLKTLAFRDKGKAIKYLNLIIKKISAKNVNTAFSKFKQNSIDQHFKLKRLNQMGRLFRSMQRKRIQKAFILITQNKNTKNSCELVDIQEKQTRKKQFARSPSHKVLPSTTSISQDFSINLSEQVRQALKNMQRFDRYIYAQNSEKKLTQPIQRELKRIQRIKNGQKQLRNTYFDNELTITCLFNHVKLIGQLNRQLNSYADIKLEKQEIQNRIIQTNMDIRKEVKERDNKNKQNAKFLEILINGLQDSSQKGKKVIESHIKYLDGDKKLLGNLIVQLLDNKNTIQSTKQFYYQQTEHIYFSNLNKLNSNISQIDKKMLTLQKDKDLFDQRVKEAKSEKLKQTYEALSSTWSCIIKLHEHIKNNSLNVQTKSQIADKKLTNVHEAGNQNLLEEILATGELGNICQKIVKGEQWIAELQILKNKFNRRPSNTKTQSSKKLFSIINELIKNTKDLKTLRDIVLSQQQKLKYFQQQNKIVQRPLLRVKSVDKLQKIDPLKVQLTQINKLCEMANSILDKRQTQNKSQLNKLKRSLQNKKRFVQMLPIITTCERLVNIIAFTQQQDKKKLLNSNRQQQIVIKQLNILGNLFEKVDTIIQMDKIESGQFHCITKTRKNLEQIQLKLSKLEENNILSDQWQKILLNSLSASNKLVDIIQILRKTDSSIRLGSPPVSPRNNIPKQQIFLQKAEIQLLRKNIKDLESRCSGLEAENSKLLNKTIINNDAEQKKKLKLQINKLNKIIQQHIKKQSESEEILKQASNEIEVLKEANQLQINNQKQILGLKNQLKKKDQEIKQSARQSKKREDDINRQLKQKQLQLKNQMQKNDKLQLSISDLIESMKLEKESKLKSQPEAEQNQLLKQINRLKNQIVNLNQKVGNNKQSNQLLVNQLSLKYQQQNLQLKQKVKELNDHIKEIQKVSTQIQQIPITNVIKGSSILIRQQDQKIYSRSIISSSNFEGLDRKQLERRLIVQIEENSNYLETIQRLSQKIYQKETQNNQLVKNHYQQMQEIIQTCKECIQLILSTGQKCENLESMKGISNILEEVVQKVNKYIGENQIGCKRNGQTKIDKNLQIKKISQINYQQPDNIYIDEIQYFGGNSMQIAGEEQHKLISRIEFLQKQKQYLYRRIKILSVFVSIDQPQKAFVHNLNCVIDRIFSFLMQSKDFVLLKLEYDYFMGFVDEISANVTQENYINYFRAVQGFFKQLLEHIYVQRSRRQQQKEFVNKINYRGSRIKSQMSEQYASKYQLSMHSEVRSRRGYKPSTLESLLNQYLSNRNVKVLAKIEEVLQSENNYSPIK